MSTIRINIFPGLPRVIDFGVTDAKGRAVGFWVVQSEFDAIDSRRLPGVITYPQPPGHWFKIRGCSARNGVRFGSADIEVIGTDFALVLKEFTARVERARKAACRKFVTEALKRNAGV